MSRDVAISTHKLDALIGEQEVRHFGVSGDKRVKKFINLFISLKILRTSPFDEGNRLFANRR